MKNKNLGVALKMLDHNNNILYNKIILSVTQGKMLIKVFKSQDSCRIIPVNIGFFLYKTTYTQEHFF